MIDSNDVQAMIEHWLDTPPNSYFGQGYGADVRSMLLRELSTSNADNLLKKLRQDIPLLNQFNDDQLSIKTVPEGFDSLHVYLVVGRIAISLSTAKPETTEQDFYDVRSQ